MRNYIRYWNNRIAKGMRITPVFKQNYYCLVPGYLGDKTHRCFEKFEKWYKRPRKAHKLYWRLHK